MARKKGSRVTVCKCGTQVVGMPGRKKRCQSCERLCKMPSAKKKAAKPTKKRKARKGKR